jgi:hypothetical protein
MRELEPVPGDLQALALVFNQSDLDNGFLFGTVQAMSSWLRLARYFSIAVLLLPALGSRSLVAAPVVAFDSFGPGNTYNTATAWGITGSSTAGGYRGQAEWFIPSVSGNLSSINLAVFRQSGSGRINYFITQDNGSGGPGTGLENYSNVLSTGFLTLNSSLSPLLQAGTKYWLCAELADSERTG